VTRARDPDHPETSLDVSRVTGVFEGRIERVVYGGFGLVRVAAPRESTSVRFVAYTLPGELVEVASVGQSNEVKLLRVLEPSADRVEPGCPHFGVCGGCHLQMASYSEQLHLKREVLRDSLTRSGVVDTPEMMTHAAEAWGYRNRIRLHVSTEDGALRFGYLERKSTRVVPITTCPIAAQLLWRTAEQMLLLTEHSAQIRRLIQRTREVELSCDDAMSAVQLALLYTEAAEPAHLDFDQAIRALKNEVPELTGAGAVLVNPKTGVVQKQLAAWGSAGLNYRVGGETYWVARNGFFQVNRFLLPTMVDLVCNGRSGQVAWDLFAGVGLFARVLARSFEQVTAVEANLLAARELNAALQRVDVSHRGVNFTTVEFLHRAVLERDRPDLVVLDPPRAGAGREVCELLARIAPQDIVYVSCDPVTLARDLAEFMRRDYRIDALHLLDLFPQTYHQEAVVVLRRRS
jgi:23S rRNA (uracil1939-C5)-methyltransferase